MSFSQKIGSTELLGQIGVCPEAGIEVDGQQLIIDLKRMSALLPIPSKPSHANYPPTIPCLFFAYGRSFKVTHTFRTKDARAKNPVEIEIFTIEIDREIAYYKRRRILSLCQEAISCYLGDNYFGHGYEVELELIPKRLTKKELKRLEAIREQILSLLCKSQR